MGLQWSEFYEKMRLPKDRQGEMDMDLITKEDNEMLTRLEQSDTSWISDLVDKTWSMNMPFNYQFEKPDGTIETLNEIDRICCRLEGKEEHPKHYCDTFQALTWLGFAIAKMSPNNVITEETIDEYAKIPRESGDEVDWEMTKKMLVRDYKFTCWYSRH